MLSRFIHHFIEHYNAWNTARLRARAQAWTEYAWGLGKRISARMADGTVEGVAESIDAHGSLIMALDGGKKQHILAADIFPAEPIKKKKRLAMLLVIDAGNTNVVFAVFDGKKLKSQWRISTDARRTADEYGVWLTQVMEYAGIAPKKVTGAVLASGGAAGDFRPAPAGAPLFLH